MHTNSTVGSFITVTNYEPCKVLYTSYSMLVIMATVIIYCQWGMEGHPFSINKCIIFIDQEGSTFKKELC